MFLYIKQYYQNKKYISYIKVMNVKLAPEQILDNWNRFLSVIDQHISSPRKEVLIDFFMS